MTYRLPLLSAFLLPMLSACSTARLPEPVRVPANLTQPCQTLPARPEPFADPDRLAWEIEVVFSYLDCQRRHGALVDAVKP